MIKTIFRALQRPSHVNVASIALIGALALSVTADAQNRRAAPAVPRVTAQTDGGVLIGNPAARVRLTEYISYTCPHCATYARESDAVLRASYVGRGTVAVEVRNLVRDPLDLTAAMLAHCGRPTAFPRRHAALMAGQAGFFNAIRAAPQGVVATMGDGTTPSQRRTIANATGMTAMMTAIGVPVAQQTICLSDAALAAKLDALRTAAFAAGVTGTPSFQLNGTLLPNTHNWAALQPQLDTALASRP